MESIDYTSWEFWAETGLIVAGGLLVLSLALRALNLLVRSSKITSLAVRPLRIVIRWIGVFIIAGLVFERFGVSVMATLTTILAMVAIGVLAVWSLLSHITATFLLIITKPFRVADTVGFPGEETKGKVIDLNMFFTTLEDKDGARFRVPNNMFFQKVTRVAPPGGERSLKRSLAEQLAAADESA